MLAAADTDAEALAEVQPLRNSDRSRQIQLAEKWPMTSLLRTKTPETAENCSWCAAVVLRLKFSRGTARGIQIQTDQGGYELL